MRRTLHVQLSSGRVDSSAVERSTFDFTAVIRYDAVDHHLTDDVQLRPCVSVVAKVTFQDARLHVLEQDFVLVAVEQFTRILEPAPAHTLKLTSRISDIFMV